MKNTFGNNVSITLFGESHGSMIGAVIDGLPSGITVNEEFISHQLDLRRPYGKISFPSSRGAGENRSRKRHIFPFLRQPEKQRAYCGRLSR